MQFSIMSLNGVIEKAPEDFKDLPKPLEKNTAVHVRTGSTVLGSEGYIRDVDFILINQEMEVLHRKTCVLHQRFASLFNHQALCDVTLISQDGTEIHAHFLYLAVHSAYFHQELSSFRKNAFHCSSGASLHIDIPSCTLQNILEYLYKGELTVTENNIEELKKIAVKLKLDDIQALLQKSKYYYPLPDSHEDGGHLYGDSRSSGSLSVDTEHSYYYKNVDSVEDSSPCADHFVVTGKSSTTRTLSPFKSQNNASGNGVSVSPETSDDKYVPGGETSYCNTDGELSRENMTVTHDKLQLQRHKRTTLKSKTTKKPAMSKVASGRCGTLAKKKSGNARQVRLPEHGLWRSSRVQDRSQTFRSSDILDYDDDLDAEKYTYTDTANCPQQMLDKMQKQTSKLSNVCVLRSKTERKHKRKSKPVQCGLSGLNVCRNKSKVTDFELVSESSRLPKRAKQKTRKCKNLYVSLEKSSTKLRNVLNKKQKEITYVSFQPLSRKICLQYRTYLFTRHAFGACCTRCDHDNERIMWKCSGCNKSFKRYSKWRLHYRSCHLLYLLLKIAKMKTLQVKKIARRRRRQSQGTLVLMNCGRVRRMPGPRSSISRTAMVKCIECGVRLASRASLKKHLLQYHNLDRQRVEQHQSLLVHCEVSSCAFANIDIQKVKRHVRESHPEVRHPCKHCYRSFVRQDLLEQHIQRIHEHLTKFVCSMCSKRFKKSCDQKIHEQQVHGIDHHFVIYSCNEACCDYQTITARYMDIHRKTKHLDNRIQCLFCSVKFKTKLGLEMHVNALHLNKRQYLCEICASGFCDPWSLQRHIAFRHNTARDYTCRHCHYACNNRIQFMNHTYQQHGVKVEFDTREEKTCPVCGYKALSNSRINAHIRQIHADPNKYTCEVCGKGFKNQHYLRDHQVIHSNSTYQCPHCDYSPWSSNKLKKHIRTQHTFKEMKPYSCPYCTYACTTSGNCRKHVVRKHPGCEVWYNTNKVMLEHMRKVENEQQTSKFKPVVAKKS